MQHVSTAAGVAVLGYLLYIAVASTPLEAMDRTCSPPFQWPKKALVSAAKLGSPSSVAGIESTFDSGFNGCRAWVWGTFYEDEYQKMLAAQAKEAAGKVAK